MNRCRRGSVVAVLVAGCLISPGETAAQSSVQQWRRWETTVTSSYDFTANDGNPYRDLIVRVRFTRQGSGATFTQDAFWEGLSSAPRQFKVRTALPPGTWDLTVSCTGTTGGRNCADGSITWSLGASSVTVTTNTSSGIRLYDRGFLTQLGLLAKTYPPRYLSWTELRYGDTVTPFFWAGDTAWVAPPREISGQTSKWSSYVSSRRNKGFTAVLIAPALAWQPGPVDPWPDLPGALDFSFTQTSGCANQPIPNDCSRPRPEYWQAFDDLVKQANDQDLLVGIVGVMDPVGLGDASSPFPNRANAEDFARYLAARLAGSHVVYSPGFDTRLDLTTAAGESTPAVMNAVGRALKAAAPRHLVTNHLAGRSTCPDYQSFADPSLDAWMTFYVFQSGKAQVSLPATGHACPPRSSAETALRAAIRRAREMPLTLKSYTSPAMPNFNGEGPYDDTPYSTNHPVNNRYRVRHAGHLTSLSDGMGFTYGASRLIFWHQPGSYFNLLSTTDMQVMANRFRNRAGLPARHGWILNQPADPRHEEKMALASDDSSLVLAYVPGEGPPSISISKSTLSTLSCTSGWTIKWFVPFRTDPDTRPIACTSTGAQVMITRPECLPGINLDCDWVLELQRTGSALSGPSTELGAETIEVWSETPDGAASPEIHLALRDPALGPNPARAVVSPVVGAFQGAPRVARLGQGYLVVWEAERLDGSLRGVFARRVAPAGQVVGPRVQVNRYSEHDQAEPAVATDALGNAVVAWTSYGQDGDLGGIFARRFDPFLSPVGEEFQVNALADGHQLKPQVAADALGNYVVAWSTAPATGQPARISFRRFSSPEQALTPEILVAEGERPLKLVGLAVDGLGEVRVRWTEEEWTGAQRAVYEQRFTPSGIALGDPEPGAP